MTPHRTPQTLPNAGALQIAARCFGRLEAQGLLRPGEAAGVLFAATRGHPGLRAGSLRLLQDTRQATALARRRATDRIRAAIRPLIAAWAAPGAILRAALREAGADLSQPEAARIATTELRRRLERTQ